MPVTADTSQQYRTRFVFVAVMPGYGAPIDYPTHPGARYASPDKPRFKPPDWIFTPVRSLIDSLLAIAGWRTYRLGPGGTVGTLRLRPEREFPPDLEICFGEADRT